MLVRSHIAPMFATNCWIIADQPGGECIIVDPGMTDIRAEVEMIIEQEGLKPVAALLTHGHLDHTFSIVPLADGYQIPTYIHSEDRRYVSQPAGILSPEFTAQIEGMDFQEPSQLLNLKDGDSLEITGIKIRAIHAPGHTRGSLMFMLNDDVLISGDVLFAGSIGRTDLPSGSPADMRNTLIKKILPLSDDVRVLTGHGKETTIRAERKHNPYLVELQ